MQSQDNGSPQPDSPAGKNLDKSLLHENSVVMTEETNKRLSVQNCKESCAKFFKYLGPAWIISCTVIDPGGVEGALQSGAYTGYALLWVTLWSTVMVFAFQMYAARIGMATGKNLSKLQTLFGNKKEKREHGPNQLASELVPSLEQYC